MLEQLKEVRKTVFLLVIGLSQREKEQPGFPGGAVVKNLPANAGDARDVGSISGLGRSPGGGNDNPLQYSCLENPIDRGTWLATVHSIAELDTTETT